MGRGGSSRTSLIRRGLGDQRPALRTQLNPGYFHKGPVSKYSHAGGWALKREFWRGQRHSVHSSPQGPEQCPARSTAREPESAVSEPAGSEGGGHGRGNLGPTMDADRGREGSRRTDPGSPCSRPRCPTPGCGPLSLQSPSVAVSSPVRGSWEERGQRRRHLGAWLTQTQ